MYCKYALIITLRNCTNWQSQTIRIFPTICGKNTDCFCEKKVVRKRLWEQNLWRIFLHHYQPVLEGKSDQATPRFYM